MENPIKLVEYSDSDRETVETTNLKAYRETDKTTNLEALTNLCYL